MSSLILNLLLLTLCLNVCWSGRTDKTVVDKANGKDVVEAVDDLIKSSGIFLDNHKFVIRMAYVATQFGEDPATFTTKFNIWGMVQAKFDMTKDTKTHPTLTAIYLKINQNFGIDWSKVLFADLSKPLIGGLAINIFLAINPPIPVLLEEQGNYYNKFFSTITTSQQFYEKVKTMDKIGLCSGRMDLAIVLDGSGSIGMDSFKIAKTFVSNLVDTFSLTNVNLGFIVFSKESTVVFPMNNKLKLADMKIDIMNAAYPGQGTNTSGAINVARDMLLNAIHRDGTPKIMTIFTDGAPDDQASTILEAQKSDKEHINLFAVGIGTGINQANLLAMVLNKPTRVFSVSSFKSLSESFDMMNSETCKITQKPDVGKNVTDTLNKNEKRYFCYDLPTIGITVSLEVKVGKTDSFYSYTQENPSSALNDGIISGKTFIPTDQGSPTKRVCVTVEGIEIHNNFTITTETGNKTVSNPDPDDGLIHIKNKAKEIAKNAFDNLKNYNQISNQICNEMSNSYSKYEWICIVGEKVEISEHMFPKSFFQFGFEFGVTDFFFIVNVPDN